MEVQFITRNLQFGINVGLGFTNRWQYNNCDFD